MAEAFLRYERQCDARALHRFLLLSLLCAMSHVYAFLFAHGAVRAPVAMDELHGWTPPPELCGTLAA